MSQADKFLQRHENLLGELASAYPELSVAGSENALLLGSFPSIGLFLGIPAHSVHSRACVIVQHSFVLVCFDLLDNDDPADQLAKQKSTLASLLDIIDKFSFNILTEIEPITTIATGEGSFVTGWTTMITFNA